MTTTEKNADALLAQANRPGTRRRDQERLCDAINEYLAEGQLSEVLIFFAQANSDALPVFSEYQESGIPELNNNPDNWLALLEVLLPRKILPVFAGLPVLNEDQAKRFTELFQQHIDLLMAACELSSEYFRELCRLLDKLLRTSGRKNRDLALIQPALVKLPHQFIDYQRQQKPLDREDITLVNNLAGDLANSPTDSAAALKEIHWRLAIRKEANIDDETGIKHSNWWTLIHTLSDQDLLSLIGQDSHLDSQLLCEWQRREEYATDKEQHWQPWTVNFEQQPESVALPGNFRQLQQRWQNTSTDSARANILTTFMYRLGSCADPEQLSGLYLTLADMISEAPDVPAKAIADHGHQNLNAAHFIERFGNQSALFALLVSITEEYDRYLARRAYADLENDEEIQQELDEEAQQLPDYIAILDKVLARSPQLAQRLSAQQLLIIGHILSAEVLAGLVPHLDINRKNASKQLWKFWANKASELPIAAFEAADWFENQTKSLQRLALEVLLAHPDDKAIPWLQSLYTPAQEWMNFHDTSRIEDRLHCNGEVPTLAVLEQRATRLGSPDSDVLDALQPELLQAAQPLSKQAMMAMLQLFKEAGKEPLSPLALKLMQSLNNEQQLTLNQLLLDQWIHAKGSEFLLWKLKKLTSTPDNSLVDRLFAAIKQWHKPRWKEAMLALDQLASLNTTYALMHVHMLSSTKGIRQSIAERAERILQASAKQQGLSLEDLIDQLTPDLGLSEGICIELGEQTFKVELQGDLTLRVRNDKGKLSKTIPKPKESKLLKRWEKAKQQLSELNKSLKAVIKRQQPAMYAAFVTGRQWPFDTWRSLFFDSPLFKVMGQSLIWADSNGQSFRIAEDLSLMDFDDEQVNLTADSRITLWHPVNASEAERQSWIDHLSDYEINPLIDQIGAGHQLPAKIDGPCRGLISLHDQKIDCQQLLTLLKTFGYRRCEQGSGNSTISHDWSHSPEALMIKLEHSPIDMHYREYYLDCYEDLPHLRMITLEGIHVSQHHEWDGVAIDTLPKALQATLQSHINTLLAAARTPA
jgi:hypothetical protein